MKTLSMLPGPDKTIVLPIKRKQKRGQFYFMYKKSIWQKIRKQKLMQSPLCEFCIKRGKQRATVCIDHIQAHRGNWKLFLDFNNLQGLCKKCHNIKSAKEKANDYSI